MNGTVSTSDEKCTSNEVHENGSISKKGKWSLSKFTKNIQFFFSGKGKALRKTKGVIEIPQKTTKPRKTAIDLYKEFLNAQCVEEDSDSSSEDDDYKSFESPHGNFNRKLNFLF